MTEISDIQLHLHRFAVDRDWYKYHLPGNLAKAINVEASELLEDFIWRDPSHDTGYHARASEEIADIMIYCLQFCSVMQIDPLQAIKDKIAINEQKYPVEKCKGKATKYDAL
jgi:NTP pyrophosphatase (non-canonical NTP hydrolase)